MYHSKFSNSLIIHEEKTKQNTTVKEVWICDPNYHKIWISDETLFLVFDILHKKTAVKFMERVDVVVKQTNKHVCKELSVWHLIFSFSPLHCVVGM